MQNFHWRPIWGTSKKKFLLEKKYCDEMKEELKLFEKCDRWYLINLII